MLRTYHGSCHCRAVRFTAEIDLSEGTGKCNCTHCWKHRYWGLQVPPERFRLLSGAEALSRGAPGEGTGEGMGIGGFCTTCGTHVCGYNPVSDWNPAASISISVAALDDLTPAELLAAPVTYYDGLHDNWWEAPAETRHL